MKKPRRLVRNKPVRLILGLGNPGTTYAGTRHNVGFDTIDILADLTGIPLRKSLFGGYIFGTGSHENIDIALAKPLTFMNRSGAAVPSLLRRFSLEPERMLIVCDTLDLEPGMCRLKRSGGSAGHKGIASVMQAAGSGDFMRIYIGIGHPGNKAGVPDWVLDRPDGADMDLIRGAEREAAESILRLLTEPPERVMHDLNRKKTSENS